MKTWVQGEVLTANDLNTALSTGINTERWAFSNTVSFSNTVNFAAASFANTTNFTGNVSIANTSIFYAPGTIVQANNTYFTTPTSYSIPASYSTYTDVPGLSVNITPRSANSKIYITARIFGEFNATSGTWDVIFAIKRNGTPINLPPQPGTNNLGHHMATTTYTNTDADSTPEPCFFDMMDSPANTGILTYTVGACSGGSYTHYINRCVNGATTPGYERGTSSITVFEIAQ